MCYFATVNVLIAHYPPTSKTLYRAIDEVDWMTRCSDMAI